MSYYWFNREKWKMESINIIIKEVKRDAKYYIANKEVLRENARNKYRNLPEKEKDKKENIKEKDITMILI